MKRDPSQPYAHAGRRRRKITEELIRCPTVEIVHGQTLPCNALIWNKPEALREHLAEHRPDSVVRKLTDQEIREWYVEAKTIHQEGIPCDDQEEN